MKVIFCFRVGDNVFNNSLLEERVSLPRKNVFLSRDILPTAMHIDIVNLQ